MAKNLFIFLAAVGLAGAPFIFSLMPAKKSEPPREEMTAEEIKAKIWSARVGRLDRALAEYSNAHYLTWPEFSAIARAADVDPRETFPILAREMTKPDRPFTADQAEKMARGNVGVLVPLARKVFLEILNR